MRRAGNAAPEPPGGPLSASEYSCEITCRQTPEHLTEDNPEKDGNCDDLKKAQAKQTRLLVMSSSSCFAKTTPNPKVFWY